MMTRKLSAAGEQVISELVQRHSFSRDAVMSMLESLAAGNGVMAQFKHPEFGGSGQWMRGGMTMVSDMFNHSLKARIDALCSELSGLLANDRGFTQASAFQSQSQRVGQQHDRPEETDAGVLGESAPEHRENESTSSEPPNLFAHLEPAMEQWWRAALGAPTGSGAQNGARYAYFAEARRLAVDINGRVTIYDTLDHRIGGVSQQQSHGAALNFRSQHGLVDVASLPIVTVNGEMQNAPTQGQMQRQPSPQHPSSTDVANVLSTIEKLAELHARGILSDAEFTAKKAELLGRL